MTTRIQHYWDCGIQCYWCANNWDGGGDLQLTNGIVLDRYMGNCWRGWVFPKAKIKMIIEEYWLLENMFMSKAAIISNISRLNNLAKAEFNTRQQNDYLKIARDLACELDKENMGKDPTKNS